MCDCVADVDCGQRRKSRIEAQEVHAAFALRDVVEDQHRDEPNQNVLETRIESARLSRRLDGDYWQQDCPWHEAREQSHFHVVERMDVAFVEIVAAGEAKNIFSENLFAEETWTAFDIRREVPSAGENEHDDRAAEKTHS